ncbi:MAG: PAS domain-containing protein [Nannocystis sp.]|nr:PAS domain-containing protein [Nannocystis sp.]MBA3550019.1 PAS domain-containing protein [Nannocystis sp.]
MDHANGDVALLEKAAAKLPGLLYSFRVGPDGSFSFVYLSEGCRALYEVAPEVILADFTVALAMVHPQDLAGFTQSVAEAVEKLHLWERELRLCTSSGAVKWIQARSQPEREPDGGTSFSGVMLDITRHKASEGRLRGEIQRLSAPLIRVWDGVLVVPLIGDFGDNRLQAVLSEVLPTMRREAISCVIFDFTGVVGGGEVIANELHRAVQGIALLGGSAVVTGMSPALVIAVARTPHPLTGVVMHGTLASALRSIVRRDG